ncbi:unnamed protein product, partial [marine sediment metagenome]
EVIGREISTIANADEGRHANVQIVSVLQYDQSHRPTLGKKGDTASFWIDSREGGV